MRYIHTVRANKLILQYLKTRCCKYYTLYNPYCIITQYYNVKPKYTSTEPSSQDYNDHSRNCIKIIRIRY